MSRNKEWAEKVIEQLIKEEYYGKLTLSFEKGKISLIKKEETLKPK